MCIAVEKSSYEGVVLAQETSLGKKIAALALILTHPNEPRQPRLFTPHLTGPEPTLI